MLTRRSFFGLSALSFLPVDVLGYSASGLLVLPFPLERKAHHPILAESLGQWAQREREQENREALYAHVDGGIFFFPA